MNLVELYKKKGLNKTLCFYDKNGYLRCHHCGGYMRYINDIATCDKCGAVGVYG